MGDVHHPQSEDGGGVLRRLGGRPRAVLVPVGVFQGGVALLDSKVLVLGAGVALLSSAIPYSLEMEALRRIPAKVFGVLMSLEPAVAALVGLVVLGEVLQPRAIVAVFLVTIAAIGASRFASGDKD